MNLLKTALIAVSFIVYPLSFAQEEIGVAAAVNTKTVDMVAYPGGNIQNVNVDPGYKIISNRTIETNKSGKAQMLLVDGTAFTIGPNSRVTLDKFIYDPATASGSLEVSAKGLVRLVGGKVTKKRPAIIKTSTATVGIRGGIAIVEANPEETKASFVYGVEMEVAPLENPDNSLVLTQVGLSVEVEAGSDEVEDPEVLTSEELDSYSDDFEGNEEPDEESDTEESEDSSEESEESEGSEESEETEEDSDESEDSEESEEEAEENEDSEESEEEEAEESEESEEEEAEESEESEEEAEESEESEEEAEETEESEESEEAEETEETDESEESEEDSEDAKEAEEVEDNQESDEDSEETQEVEETEETESEEVEEVEEEAESENVDDSEETNDSSTGDDSSEVEENESNQSSDSETQDDGNSSDDSNDPQEEAIPQESTDTEDEPSENNTPLETTSSDEDSTSNDGSETSNIGTEEDSQKQSSDNIESNDGVANETTSSDTSGNTADNDSANDQFSEGSKSEVETQPASNENQSAPEVQRPTVVSTSSGDETSTPTQPNQGREIKDTPLTRPTEEPATSPEPVTTSSSSDPITVTQPVTASSSSDSVPLVQPPTSTSSSDSVQLVQPPITTSSSDSVPLVQPPVATSSTETLTLEPLTQEPEPVIPEIDESLLDSFDISKNTSDTGIENLTTAFDQGGELFIDETQIETQEEEFIEEATQVNEEVQVEEVQKEEKVEAVVEAILSANTFFVSNEIKETTLAGTSIGSIEVDYLGDENIEFALGGNGSDDFKIDEQGKITIKNKLDFETKDKYNLFVFTIMGDKQISNKLEINVLNENDLDTNIALSKDKLHEGVSLNTVVGNASASGDTSITYSLEGENSSDFTIDENGIIKVAKILNFDQKEQYDLSLVVKGRYDTVKRPLKIELAKNIIPQFSVDCKNSCAVSENVSPGVTLVEAQRTDIDSDSISYKLENSYNNKFSINSQTGEVVLNGALDFEAASSFNLKIIATDSKTDKPEELTLNVINYTHVLTDSLPETDTVSKGTFQGNVTYLLNEDMETLGANDRVIGKFAVDVPGTTYSISGSENLVEIDANTGILSLKSSASWDVDELTSSEIQTKNVTVNATIPNEGVVSKLINFEPKNIEKNENLVMKFASGFNSVEHEFTGANPFTAKAHRDVSGTGGHSEQVVTETTLSKADLNSSTHINSVNDKSYTQHAGGQTIYRTSSVANGKNENDTEILDFEYVFPIDHSTGDTTHRQYAPLSSPNAQWDTERTANGEIAKYGCLDSGQGCGGAKENLTLSGNMTQATEGPHTGYKVIQANVARSLNSNLLNADADGANAGNGITSGAGSYNNIIGEYGTGFQGITSSLDTEFEIVVLPEAFEYFGQSFTHIYVNENGFLSFGNGNSYLDKPWHGATSVMSSTAPNPAAFFTGGIPLQYIHQEGAYFGGDQNRRPEGLRIPDIYGKPGTVAANNLDNTIFPLWNDYNTDSENSNWSIRKMWNAQTKILTIGWYNVKSYNSTSQNVEANFEVQLNFNNNEFKIVHGHMGSNFPSSPGNNAFVGVSKDISCASDGEDISSCEGKEYIQLFFHDNNSDSLLTTNNTNSSTFQNPEGDDSPPEIDDMYNSNFGNNQSAFGTNYCFTSSNIDSNLSNISCNSSYDASSARGNSALAPMYRFVPQTSEQKNVLLPSDIKQSYRSGLNAEFMWMHLDKDPTTLTYTPPANNATGFESGPNSRSGVSSGSLSAGTSVSHTTAKDEIVIAGEVYSNTKLNSFLNGAKKVVAYAPIPLLHTNKYELEQYSGQSDVRFKRAHTIMPNFISTDFMESKNNGSDANFDFHQLRDDDHCKGNFSCIVYNTEGSTWNAQDTSSSTKTEAHIDGMYGYANKVLDQSINVASERFGDLANNVDFVPIGQSLWYQVFNPRGRGVGLYAQINWSCGTGLGCGQDSPNKSGAPHNSQQSLFSVVITDVGDKSDFSLNNAGYSDNATGQVIDGQHYWSYKRRDGRTSITDGEYAGNQKAPQVAFGINPIACVSGPDNGCFFGDNQSTDSITPGAPSTAIISTSDPCSASGYVDGLGCDLVGNNTKNMELGVMYSMEANNSNNINNQIYKTETFYQGIAQQKQYDGSNYVDAINLSGSNSWRSGITTSADTWSGRFSGHWLTDVEADQKSMPMYFRAPLTATFDATNDRVKIIANNIYIHADPDWNENTNVGENTWYHSGDCGFGAVSWSAGSCVAVLPSNNGAIGNSGFTLQFGDDDNQKDTATFANSAYINKKVFGAMLKNESKNLNCGSLCNVNILRTSDVDNAGAMVTWDTIDEKDRDTLMTCGQANCSDPEPSLEYMTWGIWGMAVNDGLEYMTGEQPSAVHMGTWYAGDLLDVSDWPVSRTASLAGMAMFNMWKSETLSGTTTNYAWTESSRADGSVVFDGTGNYNVNINVHDLGRHACDGGASSGDVCSSGAGNNANAFSQGAMGTINWQMNGNAGQANFAKEYNATVNNGVTTWKAAKGSLYGTSTHVELGAELLFSKQDINNYLQAIGTVILSE